MQLKEYLDSRNLSFAEFAELIGVSKSCISHYVNKKRNPSLYTALRIREVTKGKVSLEDLLEEKFS